MANHPSDISSFLELIKCQDLGKVRSFLEHIPPEKVTSWTDEHSLDVMHHLILANNSEMVEYLLKRGFFVRPYTPKINPYSHLAALLGERTVLQILLQYRPDDYHDLNILMQLPDTIVEELSMQEKHSTNTTFRLPKQPNSYSNSNLSSVSSKIPTSSSSGTAGHYHIEVLSTLLTNLKPKAGVAHSPLELAARAGHVDCVSVILNQCVLKACIGDTLKDRSDFTLASIANSPQSLALLIYHKCPSREEWEAAVTVCLQRAHYSCLEVLLLLGQETKHMFKGVNFFHIVYTEANRSQSYQRLAQTTEVLIKHGHDCMARLPFRTYPMYTLLTRAFCFIDYDKTQHYIKALRVLLNHGVNPNYDEIKMEKRNSKQMVNKTVDRLPYSSALHCLLQTVESSARYLDIQVETVKSVEDCVGVLMSSNKASMNHVGYLGCPYSTNIRGSALHQLAKSSVTMGVSPAMIRCLLRHGADPNLKVDGKYAISIYFDQLFREMMSLNNVDSKEQRMRDAMMMCRLCIYMRSSAMTESLSIFLRDHCKEPSLRLQPYVNAVKDELSKRSRQIHHLRDLSAWAVWISCGCHSQRVNRLKVSSEIKTYILPLAF